jgi:hypothetical protein
MPGIAPLILAAKAIPNSLTAQELLPLSLDLIQGLLRKNIKVVSYACDGTETERSDQAEGKLSIHLQDQTPNPWL